MQRIDVTGEGITVTSATEPLVSVFGKQMRPGSSAAFALPWDEIADVSLAVTNLEPDGIRRLTLTVNTTYGRCLEVHESAEGFLEAVGGLCALSGVAVPGLAALPAGETVIWPPIRIDRHLSWAGCLNVRDLGGLPTRDGRVTRWGAVVRADSLDRLTPDGWAALHAYGIRTIVDLREDDERTSDVVRPDGVTVVTVALDDNDDAEFWYRLIDDDVDGTPLYYRPFLEHKADRCVAALTAVARAAPGGVVVHCGIGRDRTGLISLLLLALAGVTADAIAADYALSDARLRAYFGDDRDPVAERLAEHGTTIAEVIHALLDDFDAESRLELAATDRAALRRRLRG